MGRIWGEVETRYISEPSLYTKKDQPLGIAANETVKSRELFCCLDKNHGGDNDSLLCAMRTKNFGYLTPYISRDNNIFYYEMLVQCLVLM